MNTAPYVRRPRLTDRLVGHRIVVLEAGGGAGKTSLALELADACDLAPIHLRLDSRSSTQREVVAKVAGVLRRLGFTRASTVAGSTADLRTLADAVAAIDDPTLLILDDLQHASAEVLAGLDSLGQALPEPHRLVLCGRRLPDELVLGTARLGHDDLAFDLDETTLLAEQLTTEGGAAAELAAATHAITRGWVAPTVAALTVSADDRDVHSAWRSVHDVVDRILRTLSPADRDALADLAALPRLHDDIVQALGADPALRHARDAGVPVRRLGGGWFVLANPFGDALAGSHQVAADRLESAGQAYAQAGEILLGADLLRRHGADEAVAALLAGTDLDELLRAHGAELVDTVAALDDQALAAHPLALVAGSMAASVLGWPDVRRELIDRLLRLARGTASEPLAAAEDLLERVYRHAGDHERLADQARQLEARHAADPEVTARVTEVQARAIAMGTNYAYDELDAMWARCAEAWERAGSRTQAARARVWQAVQAAWAGGEAERAVQLIDAALNRAGGMPSLRMLGLLYRGMILVDIGRYVEADTTLKRTRALAVALRADVRRAHVAWFTARMTSQRGDAQGTLAAIQRAESADVNDAGGGVFFAADAATLLARVGLDDEADGRLAYALEHDPGTSEKVPLAAMDVAARRGDLRAALRWNDELQGRERIEERDRWRQRLLLAWAANATGDDRAETWSVEAFDAAAALGQPDLPFVREPAIARELVHVAARNGSRAAATLLDRGFATVQVLGGFAVEVPGSPDATPSGVQAQALKFLAVAGGRVQQESLIEALWPDVVPDRGRQRLRVVLSRLRAEVGHIVVRDGESVALAPGVAVDAIRFDDLAQRALVEDDLAVAEAAVAAYHGPLLPDDPYEDWAAVERDRLSWRYLALLDRLASAATEAGDLERALALLYVGIDEEPEVEDRYLLAARLLCDQSRHARARALLERATRVLEVHNLPPSRDLHALLDRLRT